MNAIARERLVEKIAHIAGGLPVKMPSPVTAAHDLMGGNDDIAVLVEINEIMPETWPYWERVYRDRRWQGCCPADATLPSSAAFGRRRG